MQSANIVGYQNIEQVKGKQLIQACQFQTVGGASVNLQDIVFKSNGTIPASGCTIWWWENDRPEGGDGFVAKCQWAQMYYDPEDAEAVQGFVFKPAWVRMEGGIPMRVTKVFGPGEGFFAKGDQPNPTLSISGQVFGSENTTDAVRSIDFLTKGRQLQVCNPFPTALNLQDIVFTSNDTIPASGCTIWWWENDRPEGGDGFVTKCQWAQMYYDPEDAEAVQGFVFKPAWVRMEGGIPMRVTKEFGPGEGFFVKGDQPNPKLTFPNVFYKAK